jgi:hypothetical protein
VREIAWVNKLNRVDKLTIWGWGSNARATHETLNQHQSTSRQARPQPAPYSSHKYGMHALRCQSSATHSDSLQKTTLLQLNAVNTWYESFASLLHTYLFHYCGHARLTYSYRSVIFTKLRRGGEAPRGRNLRGPI